MKKVVGLCKYCGQEKTLIASHIIPKSFYDMKNQGSYVGINYKDSKLDKARFQNGHKEHLLCAECDNKLGILDRYAAHFLFTQVPDSALIYPEEMPLCPKWYFPKASFNFNLLRRFFISLVWRASICTLIPVSLERYEKVALRILKHEQIDDENLFVPLIYRRQTGTSSDLFSMTAVSHFLSSKHFYFRFPSYEILVLTDIYETNNIAYAKALHRLFNRDGIEIYRISTNTPTDFSLINSLLTTRKKYKRTY